MWRGSEMERWTMADGEVGEWEKVDYKDGVRLV